MARVTEVTRTVDDDADRRPVATDRPVDEDPRPDGTTVAERLVYIIGGTLLALLGLRVLLSLLGANTANAFANLIYTITYPFVVPFFGLFGYEVEYGVSRLEIETIVAILVYAAVIALIAKIASVNRPGRSVS